MANNLNFGFLFSESNGSVDDSFYQNINQGSDPPGEDHDKILNSERIKPNTQVDHSMVLKWRVQAQEQGMRLLSFLREKNRDSASVKSLKRAIDTKRCSVNGRIEIFSSYLLKKGDIVVLDCVEEKAITSLNVLYEDSYLLIVDKPAYLICENRYFAPLIKSRAQLIHRLDKETSGVIMLGKDPLFIKEMIALFREKKVDKQYLALVEGVMSQEQGQVDKPLMRQQAHTPGQVHYGIAKGRAGQSALTLWKCLQKTKLASLLLCKPITGRTHQLRVHLSAIGHPILGDMQYGRGFRACLRPKRQLLHAQRIAFIHPKTQNRVDITAPIPPDFQEAMKTLKIHYE